jgi:hypothetical protein
MLSRGLCQITNTILSGEAKQEIRGIALGGSKICTPAFKNKGGPFCNNLSLKTVGPFVAAFLYFLVQADTLLVRTAFGCQLCLLRDYSLSSCFEAFYTVKFFVVDIPVPSLDVTYQTLSGQEYILYYVIIPPEGEFGK